MTQLKGPRTTSPSTAQPVSSSGAAQGQSVWWGSEVSGQESSKGHSLRPQR